MKRSIFTSLLVCLALVVALGSLATASGAAWAQGVAVSGDAGIAAAVGTAFTYQGRLAQGGNPVSGSCSFQFSLWDTASGGTQIGSTQTKTGVTLDMGYFTVELDFGADAFDGEARYLEIAVDCGSGYTTLSPRVTLTPAPYALALPGLRTQENATSPNVIGGYSGNSVTSGAVGAMIGGGGGIANVNRVTDDCGTVSGGYANRAGDNAGTTSDQRFATVGGGMDNNQRLPGRRDLERWRHGEPKEHHRRWQLHRRRLRHRRWGGHYLSRIQPGQRRHVQPVCGRRSAEHGPAPRPPGLQRRPHPDPRPAPRPPGLQRRPHPDPRAAQRQPGARRRAQGANGCGGDYTTDQRGMTRPVDAGGGVRCDVGAYERQSNELIAQNCALTQGSQFDFNTLTSGVNVKITRNTGDDPGCVTALKRSEWPGGSQSAGEFQIIWTLTAANTTYNLDLVLCYTEAELTASGVSNENSITAYRWDESYNAWNWVDKGGTVDAGANCVTVAGVTALSPWTLAGDGGIPTAVTLEAFAAIAQPDHILVTWRR